MNHKGTSEFHIKVWKDGVKLVIKASGRAFPALSFEILRIIDSDICPKGSEVIIDTSGLENADAHQLMADIIDISNLNSREIALTCTDSEGIEASGKLCLQTHCYDLPSEGWACAFARNYASNIAADTGFSKEDLDKIKIAVGEAIENAVAHGSATSFTGRICFTSRIKENSIEYTVTDSGRGFDPAAEKAKLPRPKGFGGLGINLMKDTVDKVEFSFNNGTTVKLVKHLCKPKRG